MPPQSLSNAEELPPLDPRTGNSSIDGGVEIEKLLDVDSRDNFSDEEVIDVELGEKKVHKKSKVVQKNPWYLYALSGVLTIITLVSWFQVYRSRDPSELWSVFWLAWLTALATGLGAVPFIWMHSIRPLWVGVCNAMAAGMMLAATGRLIYESALLDRLPESSDNWLAAPLASPISRSVVGGVLGVIFMEITEKILDKYEGIQFSAMDSLDAKRAILILAVMMAHSISEGVGVGVSFGGNHGHQRGLIVSIGMALHNIPEGIAISLVLIPKGMTILAASLWCIASSIPQPIFAIPAFMFVEAFLPFLPVGLGFAAGAMALVSLKELIPESLEDTKSKKITGGVTFIATVVMVGLQIIACDGVAEGN